MALYVYLKAASYPKNGPNLIGAVTGFFLMTVGVFALGISLWPIVNWQLVKLPSIDQWTLLTPQPLSNVKVATASNGFSYFINTNFEQVGSRQEFYLTIPKLGITQAKVLVNSQEFDSNLAHFPGSALPGQVGNVFITGHSALPQFYNPKNYKTIFTHLDELTNGDWLVVESGQLVYSYQVIAQKVVEPSDVSVLLPPNQLGRFLTLMTCVPPGLNTKRLVVIAVLANIEQNLN